MQVIRPFSGRFLLLLLLPLQHWAQWCCAIELFTLIYSNTNCDSVIVHIIANSKRKDALFVPVQVLVTFLTWSAIPSFTQWCLDNNKQQKRDQSALALPLVLLHYPTEPHSMTHRSPHPLTCTTHCSTDQFLSDLWFGCLQWGIFHIFVATWRSREKYQHQIFSNTFILIFDFNHSYHVYNQGLDYHT